VIIGAGFDSRAYRLNGGVWIELDEPQVIAYKNERLPVSKCKNELHRIAIDFSTESLEAKLAAFAGRSPVVVVIEGVFMYLDEQMIAQLLQTLRRLFPGHKLICDLMNRTFFEKYGRTIHEKLTGMGASFKFTADDPEELFVKNGFKRIALFSMIEKSMGVDTKPVLRFFVRTFLRTLITGYAIYEFEATR
jgi:methyltransferase (TIGR00027 family)